MKKRKVVAALATVASLTMILAACSTPSSGTAPAASGSAAAKPYIAIVSKGFSQQYWQAVKSGAEQQAKVSGATITFVGPPTESDVAIQIDQLTAALAKHPDALGFAALDSKAAAPLMAQAKAAKIPVIAFDSGVVSDVPVTTVATDNKAAAALAAKHLSDLLGGKGKVGMIIHDQTSQSGIDRRNGFVDWIKKNAPGITLLAPQYSNSNLLTAANLAKAMISSNSDLAGIYASNEASAEGAAQGVQEIGKKGLKIVGFDSGKAQIDAIKSGILAGSVTQNPVGMGKQLVLSAMDAIAGKSQPKFIDTGFLWYDKTNLTDPKIAADLYQ